MRCSVCRSTFYCGRQCQLADWPNHKLLCAKDLVAATSPKQDGTTSATTPSETQRTTNVVNDPFPYTNLTTTRNPVISSSHLIIYESLNE